MVKEIQNFDKVYWEYIYPSDGSEYQIKQSSIVKMGNDPELLYYFDLYKVGPTNATTKTADYSIGIFADHKNQHNIAAVYRKGEQASVFMDKGMSSVHFKNRDYFKTYIATLINKVI